MAAAGAGNIRAGKAFVELGANDTKLVRGLKAAQAKLRAFGAAVQGIGLRMMAFGAAGLAPLTLAVKHFASAGDTLDKMSKRTGLSAEALTLTDAALSRRTVRAVRRGVHEDHPARSHARACSRLPCHRVRPGRPA